MTASIGREIPCEIPAVGEPVQMDELMRQLGKRVIAATRTSDLAARFGESELLIVLTAMGNPLDHAGHHEPREERDDVRARTHRRSA